MSEVTVGEATRSYFNGAMRTVETTSSVMVSSSPYLNNAELRHLVAQEMLRRNGPDLPNTAFIPQVVQILHNLEDMEEIVRLFEEEKKRLPAFRTWLERRQLSDFSIDDVKHCAPGTLGAAIHDFMVNSGYSLDLFFQEIKAVNDFTFYLRQTSLTHDIEHIVTGFGPNHGGETALLTANMHSKSIYFRPELAHFFNRVATYLKAKTLMKDGLFYPEAAVVHFEAEYIGAEQGRNWTMPLMLVCWRDYIDMQIDDIRKEFNITPVVPADKWLDTNRLVEDDGSPQARPMAVAAE